MSITARSEFIIAAIKDGQTPAQIADRLQTTEGKVRSAVGMLRTQGRLPQATEAEKAGMAQYKALRAIEYNRRREEKRKFERQSIRAQVEQERQEGQAKATKEKAVDDRFVDAMPDRQKMQAQCLAHWRDLDKHHPKGWASYRISSGDSYVTSIRPSMAHAMSLSGSPAAMATEALGR